MPAAITRFQAAFENDGVHVLRLGSGRCNACGQRSHKNKRSYRRCPKHSEHYEIALWFRELASAGE